MCNREKSIQSNTHVQIQITLAFTWIYSMLGAKEHPVLGALEHEIEKIVTLKLKYNFYFCHLNDDHSFACFDFCIKIERDRQTDRQIHT